MARKRVYRCFYCKEIISEEEINDNNLIVKTNKEKYSMLADNKLCHKKCADFKQREQQELYELVEEIKSIIGITSIPPRFFIYIQDLRNGTNIAQNIKISKSKQGYRYKIIMITYQKYAKQICKGIALNNIQDDLKKLQYSYSIICRKCQSVRDEMYQDYLRKKAIQEKEEEINGEIKNVQFNVNEQNKSSSYSWLKEE